MNSQRTYIPWERFWCPLGAKINSEPGGAFLADPHGEFGRNWSPNTFTLEELLDHRCLVLCGEPGIGKTEVVKGFVTKTQSVPAHAQPDLLFVQFRSIPDLRIFEERTFESPQWKTWLESKHELIFLIDGVDEGLFVVRSFIEYLTECIRALGSDTIQRLRLILICRTLEWPPSPGQELLGLWCSLHEDSAKSRTGIFELCPLRRVDVKLAAETSGINSDAFFEVVQKKYLRDLAARPVTLFMLFDEFVKEGTISKSHRELYEATCRNLCKEPDKDRSERLRPTACFRNEHSPARLYEVGCRIAAFLMLAGKYAVLRGSPNEASKSDLPLESIAHGTEKDETGAFSVTENLVRATLATNLFDSKGPERFGFQHQTFAECMAGAYLCRMGLTQLRTLLCKRDAAGEYVIPQLAEVAAWVAGSRDDFFTHLISIEPEILLRSDVTNLCDGQKALLTKSLLEKTSRAEHFQSSDRKAFYSALSYQGLAALLRPYILDANLVITARWLAIDIAVACKLTDLLNDMLTILRRGNDPVERQAGYALDDLVDITTALALIPIAEGIFQPHVSISARRTALLGLLKTIWSVTDTLPYLRHLAHEDHWLDWQVAAKIKQSDIVPILREIRNWDAPLNLHFGLHQVVDRTCNLALDRIREPEITELLGAIVAQALVNHTFCQNGKKEQFANRVSIDEHTRHELIRAILVQNELNNSVPLLTAMYVCQPSDLRWMLKELDATSGSTRDYWAIVVSHLASHPGHLTPNWDLFLDRLERIPELKRHFEWLRAYEIESPEGRMARAHWKRHMRRERAHERLLAKHRWPPREDLMARALLRISSGKPEWWVRIADYAFVTDEGKREHGDKWHDITTSPEWKEATEERKEQIRDAARKFLLTRAEEVPREPRRSTDHADAAFIACWLLRDEIAIPCPLQASVAAHCIPSIVWYGLNDIDDHAELTKLVYKLNPERCRLAFLEKLHADANSESGLTLATRAFRTCWDNALSSIVSGFLTSETRKPETVRCLFNELAEGDPQTAKQLWQKIASAYIVRDDETAQSMGALTEITIHRFLADLWDTISAFLAQYPEVARHAFLHAAYHDRTHTETPRDGLSESQLAEYYLLLWRLFPAEEDPSWGDSGSPREITPRMEVSHFRDGVLQMLTSRGNDAACRELQRIASDIPAQDRIWILHKYREAVELKRRKAWTPIDVSAFLEIARRRDAYSVENEEDLMLVVLDSLEKLQRSLNASPEGDVLRFWHFDFVKNKRTNFRPQPEIDVAREIYSHLSHNLGGRGGAIVLREVTIRWDQKRTDIQVMVIADSDGSKRELAITIEVKGCWHNEVRKAVQTQLVEDYLRKTGRTHGIYLVAFFVCPQWEGTSKARCRLNSEEIDDARHEVAELCRPFSRATSAEYVAPFVLDCRLNI